MALLKSRSERDEPLQPTPATDLSRARSSGPATSIDESSELEGILRCKDTIRLAGKIQGEIYCERTVVVAESASVRAKIEAESVVVAGEVKGDIAASRKITLERTARVTGDLKTPGIVIEEGAKLEGRIMIGKEQGAEKASQAAKAASSAPRASAPTASPPPTA